MLVVLDGVLGPHLTHLTVSLFLCRSKSNVEVKVTVSAQKSPTRVRAKNQDGCVVRKKGGEKYFPRCWSAIQANQRFFYISVHLNFSLLASLNWNIRLFLWLAFLLYASLHNSRAFWRLVPKLLLTFNYEASCAIQIINHTWFEKGLTCVRGTCGLAPRWRDPQTQLWGSWPRFWPTGGKSRSGH